MTDLRIVTSPPGKARPYWSPHPDVKDWETFVEWLRDGPTTGGKYARPYSPIALSSRRRRNEYLELRYALTLDADAAGLDYLDRLAETVPWRRISHTTASHTPEEPRWRTLLPLSRAATPAEHKTLATHLLGLVGADRFDVQASTSPVAVAYAPAWGGVEYDDRDGPVLDVDELLAVAEPVEWNAADPVGRLTVEEFRAGYEQQSPSCSYGRSALDKEIAKLEATPEGDGVHWEIYHAAARAVELVSAGCWSIDDVDRLEEVSTGLRANERPEEFVEALANALRKTEAETGCGLHGFDDFAAVVAPPRLSDNLEWLLEGILPAGGYGILDGPPGAGKSSILGLVVREVTKKGFRVRYCVHDESIDAARQRLVLMGADLDLVEFEDVPDLGDKEAMARYAAGCATNGNDLVVVDLMPDAFLEYDSQKVDATKRWTGELIAEFCQRYRIAVLGTQHWNNNAKALSELARQSGGGWLASRSEFHWSVAISRDRTEQVWSIHRRRRVRVPRNYLMRGEGHLLGTLRDHFDPSIEDDDLLFTARHVGRTERTAYDVAREAGQEFVRGATSRDKAPEEMLARFLEGPRRRTEIDDFLYCVANERWSRQTVVDLIRRAGGVQCDKDGAPVVRGKFWIARR